MTPPDDQALGVNKQLMFGEWNRPEMHFEICTIFFWNLADCKGGFDTVMSRKQTEEWKGFDFCVT